MIFRNFNIYVSSAANLVFWERVLSEKLRIWLCLFFLLVKMAGRQHSRTSIVFLIVKPKILYYLKYFYKLGECLYHLYKFHLNWFTCTREPDSFIFTSWEWIFWSKHRRQASPRTQTYFRLSLVSAENNVCEPEPGNDYCDVKTFVSPWPIRFHDRMKLECSSQRIPRGVALGLLELNCDWLKIPTSQKSFPGSRSQTLFSAETSDSRK